MLVGVVTIPTGTASAATTLTTTVNGSSVSLTYDGEGTSASPYQIDSLAKLQGMRADLSAHYQLVQDIDASATQGWNGGAGFDPVGDAGTAFTGNLTVRITRSRISSSIGLHQIRLGCSDTSAAGSSITSISTLRRLPVEESSPGSLDTTPGRSPTPRTPATSAEPSRR